MQSRRDVSRSLILRFPFLGRMMTFVCSMCSWVALGTKCMKQWSDVWSSLEVVFLPLPAGFMVWIVIRSRCGVEVPRPVLRHKNPEGWLEGLWKGSSPRTTVYEQSAPAVMCLLVGFLFNQAIYYLPHHFLVNRMASYWEEISSHFNQM